MKFENRIARCSLAVVAATLATATSVVAAPSAAAAAGRCTPFYTPDAAPGHVAAANVARTTSRLKHDGKTSLRGTTAYALTQLYEVSVWTRHSLGDVNADDRITALDARLAYDIAKGRRSANPCEYITADYNLSGYVTEADGYLLSRRAAGLG
jgi:hypothetical protein